LRIAAVFAGSRRRFALTFPRATGISSIECAYFLLSRLWAKIGLA